MYTPHVVTVYNVRENSETLKPVNNVTVLPHVFYDGTKGANVRATGLENADSVTLYVPLNHGAYDGRTGQIKKYVPPNIFRNLDDTSSFWTLEPGEDCFFIKGKVVSDASFKELNADYDTHRITKVDLKDFGSKHMQHWEVGGA